MMERGILVRDFGTSIKEVNFKDSGTNQVTSVAMQYIPSAFIFFASTVPPGSIDPFTASPCRDFPSVFPR